MSDGKVYEQEIRIPEYQPRIDAGTIGDKTPGGSGVFGRKNKLSLILEKIEDPQVDPAEISRMIAVEIADTAREMADNIRDPIMQWLQKAYEIQIKALRELSKQLQDTEVLSKKDVLNWEGAKFQFVLLELMKLYKQALRDAGVEESLSQNVLKHYRDLLGTNEVRIRRDVEKQTSNLK